jgi:hypothetical protein
MDTTSLIKHYKELNFTVVATPDTHHVNFKVYDITGWEQSSDSKLWDVPCWGTDFSSTLDQAEVYLHGSVKWDGCSNWHFDEQERVMLHGCERQQITRYGEVLGLCWDWTAELCPNWNSLITKPAPQITDEQILRLAAQELGYEFSEKFFLAGNKGPCLETYPLELLNFARAVEAHLKNA